jgi:hypothetical protein
MSAIAHEPPTPLENPVRVEVLSRDACEGSELLEALVVADGPAADSINGTRMRLLKGEAPWQQTAAFLVEEHTETPLAVVSACLDGDPRAENQEDAILKRAAGNPYVNIVFRDTRQHNRVLLDGETRLGTAVLWAFLELGLRERPGLNGLPRLAYALVATENEPAIGAFEAAEFEQHELRQPPMLSGEGRETKSGIWLPPQPHVAMVRAAGLPLPDCRNFDAYRPLLGVEYFEPRDAA